MAAAEEDGVMNCHESQRLQGLVSYDAVGGGLLDLSESKQVRVSPFIVTSP